MAAVDRGLLIFHGKLAIANAIVSIAVGHTIDAGAAQLIAGVMGKDIIHHSTLTGRIAGGRATEFIIVNDERDKKMISLPVCPCFVCMREV